MPVSRGPLPLLPATSTTMPTSPKSVPPTVQISASISIFCLMLIAHLLEQVEVDHVQHLRRLVVLHAEKDAVAGVLLDLAQADVARVIVRPWDELDLLVLIAPEAQQRQQEQPGVAELHGLRAKQLEPLADALAHTPSM